MQKRYAISIISVVLCLMLTLFIPVEYFENSHAILVDDGTLDDWVNAKLTLNDDMFDVPPGNDMTDLTLVSFDYDHTWLYVRWDLYDNLSYKSGILYDMGINLTGTGSVWDIFVSAQIDLVGGFPKIVNISIRDTSDNHVWNASDDGNMTQDGALYLDPTPGLSPGNLSVEARFPLAYIGLVTGVVFGQFRSHSSPSVNSAVKDRVPDSGYIILLIDNNPPQLYNVTAAPNPQENGNPVNITVNATDDFGIGSVWVNITRPDGTWFNVSMTNGTMGTWFLEDIYDIPGLYFFNISANDSSNNWVTFPPQSFLIIDTDGPFISNIQAQPNPQENLEDVTLSVDVTDDVGVSTVRVNITYPDGSSINVTMTKGPGNGWFYTDSYDQLGNHSYTIWARDTSGNWNTASPGTFFIRDTDGPFFDNLADSPDPQENGFFVNVSLDVTDDIGVDSVGINITYPDSSYVNTSMIKGPLSLWYCIMAYDDLGEYNYTIWATDTSGNQAETGPGSFTIRDTDPPEISQISAFPDPQVRNGNVNISARVTDDVSVALVYIEIRNPDGVWSNHTMVPGMNDHWFLDSTFSELGSYVYTITAVDFSGNTNFTTLETFVIIDTQDPQIGIPVVTPNPQEPGKDINITVPVVDDDGISLVTINITYPNGTWITDTMKKGPGDTWYYNGTFLTPGNFTYTIYAEDNSGNSQNSGPHPFGIQPGPQPEPSPEKRPRKLYIALTLLYWPLLLIIFTAVFERRYGFGNRAKKDIEPLAATILASSQTGLKDTAGDPLGRLVMLCQKTGIPPEEFIFAALTTDIPSNIQNHELSRILENMREKYDG